MCMTDRDMPTHHACVRRCRHLRQISWLLLGLAGVALVVGLMWRSVLPALKGSLGIALLVSLLLSVVFRMMAAAADRDRPGD